MADINNRLNKNTIDTRNKLFKDFIPIIYKRTIKTIDGIITPLVLITLNLIFVDSSYDILFGKLRGLILYPFIDCNSIPIIEKNVCFTELLTRKYKFGKKIEFVRVVNLMAQYKLGTMYT